MYTSGGIAWRLLGRRFQGANAVTAAVTAVRIAAWITRRDWSGEIRLAVVESSPDMVTAITGPTSRKRRSRDSGSASEVFVCDMLLSPIDRSGRTCARPTGFFGCCPGVPYGSGGGFRLDLRTNPA